MLPEHLAFVTKWANCGDLASYVSTYAQQNVRLACIQYFTL